MTSTTAAETEQQKKDKALKQAYQAATSQLRVDYRDAFNTLYAAEAKKRGVTWEPKATAEEKAEKEMADLLARYPHLAEKIVSPAEPFGGNVEVVPPGPTDRADV